MERRRQTKLLAFLFVLVVPALSVPQGQICTKPSGETSSCVCQTQNGVVDLRPAASDNGIAKYKGMEDANNFVYEYNPCYPFTTAGDCSNVHLCQETKDIPPSTYKIADGGTEQMYIDSAEKVTVFYTSTDQYGTYREVNVHLDCDTAVTNPIVTTTGDSITIFTYEVSFKSCHACPGGCGGGGGGGGAAGVVGIVLILLLVAGFAAYFVVGAVIMKVRFNKTGLEMIPQKNFWFALPGLIKAGVIFTFQPLINLIKNRGGGGGGGQYEQM